MPFTLPVSPLHAFKRLSIKQCTRRGYSTLPTPPQMQSFAHPQQFQWKKIIQAVGIVAGTAAVSHLALNRETREALNLTERELLHNTFRYMGAGLATVGIAAYGMHNAGVSQMLMRANPWLVLGVGLGSSIGTLMLVRSISPQNKAAKHGAWVAFNVAQAVTLAPLFFVAPAILARAAWYSAGIVGGLAWVGATAKEETYLYLGGPLVAGMAVVAMSSLAPMVLPTTALRSLALAESLSLYGGLGVFSFAILYDVQKVLYHARLVAMGRMEADPINESIGLELNAINIFIRLVFILQGNSQRKR